MGLSTSTNTKSDTGVAAAVAVNLAFVDNTASVGDNATLSADSVDVKAAMIAGTTNTFQARALAGAPAFEGDDERAVMFQILERGAPALVTRAVDIPADVARVVERCLERRREDRFESARDVHAALSADLRAAASAAPISATTWRSASRTPIPARRRRSASRPASLARPAPERAPSRARSRASARRAAGRARSARARASS